MISNNVKLTNTTNMPHVEVLDSTLAGSGLVRVACQLTHKNDSATDKPRILEALSRKFGFKMLPVPNSWAVVASDVFTSTITGIMATNNRETVPYTPTNTDFRCVSGNMFIDDEKEIWRLQETAAGKILIKTTSYDDDETLTKLLKSVSSANSQYFARGVNSMGYKGGDFVAFVSPRTATTQVGFVVASAVNETTQGEDLVVLATTEAGSELIDPNLVVGVYNVEPEVISVMHDSSMQAVATGKKNVVIDDVLNFYKTVYSRNADYFAKFSALVTSHAFA